MSWSRTGRSRGVPLVQQLSGWRRGLPGLLVAVVGGCGSGGEPPEPCTGGVEDVSFRLTGPQGELLSRYQLTVTPDDPDAGSRRQVACPEGPADGPLRCAAEGGRLDRLPGGFQLTVQAPGFHTTSRVVTRAELDRLQPADGSECRPVLELTPAPLPSFVEHPSYRTGLPEADGREAFEQLAQPFDTELGEAQVVKFLILGLDSSPEVYLQHTRRHPIHYDFVRNVLGVPVTRAEFEARTYRGEGRTGFAGTLLRYPELRTRSASLGPAGGELTSPWVLTFFPSDDLTPGQALLAYRVLEERLLCLALAGGTDRLVYLPAGEVQEEQLQTEDARRLFSGEDVLWLTRAELYGNLRLQLLNPGLAYGTLRRLTPEQLRTAVVSFTDILLLTRLPNELPIVGGTITEELQTPLAHVNVAARTRGTPNLAWLDAGQAPEVRALLDRLVRFEVRDGSYTLEETTAEEARRFWESRRPEPLVPEHDSDRSGLPSFGELHFADARSIGVKAANLAELSQLLGERAPTGLAVPFHYAVQFLRTTPVAVERCNQARPACAAGRPAAVCDRARALCLPPDGQPELLADQVTRLLENEQFRQDSPLREATLAQLRFIIEHSPVDPAFAAELDRRIAEQFGQAPVRLRSSTNSEDLPGFSGAGLYRSVTAYGQGDSKRASERIRLVWASVWNWRAFEERTFWGIDHQAVRVGVAVHHAYPDEQANGVLITQNLADPTVAGMYVNVQQGELEVTNPEAGTLPEIFSILPGPTDLQVARQRWSSLSPDRPLLTDAEVHALFRAAQQVQGHFARLYSQNPNVLALDLEFKFHGPTRALIIKQARPFSWSPG